MNISNSGKGVLCAELGLLAGYVCHFGAIGFAVSLVLMVGAGALSAKIRD